MSCAVKKKNDNMFDEHFYNLREQYVNIINEITTFIEKRASIEKLNGGSSNNINSFLYAKECIVDEGNIAQYMYAYGGGWYEIKSNKFRSLRKTFNGITDSIKKYIKYPESNNSDSDSDSDNGDESDSNENEDY